MYFLLFIVLLLIMYRLIMCSLLMVVVRMCCCGLFSLGMLVIMLVNVGWVFVCVSRVMLL